MVGQEGYGVDGSRPVCIPAKNRILQCQDVGHGDVESSEVCCMILDRNAERYNFVRHDFPCECGSCPVACSMPASTIADSKTEGDLCMSSF